MMLSPNSYAAYCIIYSEHNLLYFFTLVQKYFFTDAVISFKDGLLSKPSVTIQGSIVAYKPPL